MYAVLEAPDRVVKSVRVIVATLLVVATNDVNVEVAGSVVVKVSVEEVTYIVEVGVFVEPALTIDMYAVAALYVAYQKSSVMIPGLIEVTGIPH